MTYKEKLEHPKWQRRRQDILVRDNYKCAFCGDTETQVHVHHKYYDRSAEPWDYPDDALQTLCKHCHLIITDHQKDAKVMEVIKISKVASISKEIWFFQVLTIDPEGVFTICLYTIDKSNELLFKTLIPGHQFQNTIDLINFSKSYQNGK